MQAFKIDEIGKITEDFIRKNKHLAFSPNILETDARHILIKAENLFSALYCLITNDVHLIRKWTELQRRLYQETENKFNQYLIYVIPESVVKDNDLYQELSIAEHNEFFFRKVFIDIPRDYNRKIVEGSLRRRIPIWMAEREKTLHEYVPSIEELIPDTHLRRLLLSRTAPTIVQELGKNNQFKWLFSDKPYSASKSIDVMDSLSTIDLKGKSIRIESLELENFRCFKHILLNLDANVVVIFGKNGKGKTTIVDALEFALFNKIERLEYDPDIVARRKSKFHALINSELNEPQEARISITGASSSTQFKITTKILTDKCINLVDGKQATSKDVISLLTQNEELTKKKEYLDILLHTHFLGQHSIRHFIYGSGKKSEDVTKDRYDLLSEMFGLGKIEFLRKRVEKVCNEIMRDKITASEHVINQFKSTLRSIQQKYGPKVQSQLKSKGYEIETKSAINLYRHLLDELKKEPHFSLGQDVVNCKLPAANFIGACQSIANKLDQELKKIKVREADIDKLSKLQVKLETVFQNANIKLEVDNPTDFPKKVRAFLREVTKDLEDHRHTLRLTSSKINELKNIQGILKEFQSRFIEYQSLKSSERTLLQQVEDLRKANTKLVQDRLQIEHKLQEAKKTKRNLEFDIENLQRRLSSISHLKEKHIDLETKRTRLEENQSKIAEIKRLLLESDIKTKYKPAVQLSHLKIDSIQKFLEGEDYFLSNNHYSCPCCGSNYENKRDLNDRIAIQTIQGRYKDALISFLTIVGSSYQKSGAKAIRTLLDMKQNERNKLEKENAVILGEIKEYENLIFKVSGKKKISEVDLLVLHNEAQSDLGVKKELLSKNDVDPLQIQLQRINQEISALKIASYEKGYKEIKDRLIVLTKGVNNILSEKEFASLTIVEDRIAQCTADLTKYTQQLTNLAKEIDEKSSFYDRFNELTADLAEIESILNKYKLTDLSINESYKERAGGITQRRYFEMTERANDLAILFGLIGTQEESERIQIHMKKEEAKKTEWTHCYDRLRKLNEHLSKDSYAGLEKNLEQYSPLINEVYKKFIRHELFSEVQLKPQATKGRRKRSLYIHLKNYTGGVDFTPASFLSEAQLNILALSIFLTRVIYQNMSVLQTVLIDDPIQQMDDMNATSFIDIILGLSQSGKQLVITTCNAEFFELICQKMSQVGTPNEKKFLAIDIESLLNNRNELMQLQN